MRAAHRCTSSAECLEVLLLVAEEHRHGQQQRPCAGVDRCASRAAMTWCMRWRRQCRRAARMPGQTRLAARSIRIVRSAVSKCGYSPVAPPMQMPETPASSTKAMMRSNVSRSTWPSSSSGRDDRGEEPRHRRMRKETSADAVHRTVHHASTKLHRRGVEPHAHPDPSERRAPRLLQCRAPDARSQAADRPFLTSELIFPLEHWHNHASMVVELPGGDLLACWFHGSGERTADDVLIRGARLKKGSSRWSAAVRDGRHAGLSGYQRHDVHRSERSGCGCCGRRSWRTSGTPR